MIQIQSYAEGIDFGLGPLGLLALSNAFKEFNAWAMQQLRARQASIAVTPSSSSSATVELDVLTPGGPRPR
jgi:hypothetical protein